MYDYVLGKEIPYSPKMLKKSKEESVPMHKKKIIEVQWHLKDKQNLPLHKLEFC